MKFCSPWLLTYNIQDDWPKRIPKIMAVEQQAKIKEYSLRYCEENKEK